MIKQLYLKWGFAAGFLLFCSMLTLAQSSAVTGKVKDDGGAEMPGVNVILKGSSIGTTTDANGNYTLSNVPGNGTLVFSFIGYKTQEVTVNNRTAIEVALASDVAALNEVVVVGYGTSLKKDITTSIVKIDPKSIPTAANASVGDMLFGRAAGLQASQQSAQPGGLVNLSIRGRETPLIVVDGIVMPNNSLEPGINFAEVNNVSRGGLAGINPNDIESIEVLKDGAASIYGVAAGNGVILITTKKGKSGSMNINYTGSVSVQKNFHYMEPLNATEYMKYYNRLSQDKYLTTNNMAPFGPTAQANVPVKFSDAEIANPTYNTNWVDQVLRTGQITNHTLGINGGTDRMTYYFSGNYFDQIGTVQNSDFKKYNGKMDLSFKVNKIITLNTSMIGSRNYYTNTVAGWQTGGAGSNAYTALASAFAYPSILPLTDPATGKYSQFQVIGNPVSQLNTRDKTQYGSLYATASADVTILPNVLTGKVLYGNNMENSFRDFYIPSTTNWFDAYQSRGSLQWAKRQTQTMETYLTFKKKLGKAIGVNAVAGIGQYIYDDFSFGQQATGMIDGVNTSNVSGAPSQGNSSKNRNVKRSYFIRGTADFLDRYILTASIRRDGYSQFFPDSKYQNFPSVSVGWKISNESFFGNSNIVDLLKLRASTGMLGTLLPNGQAYAQYTPDADVVSFNNGGTHYVPYPLTQFSHPDLTWQKTINKNIGLDVGLFNNRISAALDWFRDDVTSLLNAKANTPALSQLASQPVNGGHQVRTGYEVALNGSAMRSDKFTWDVILNLSHYSFKWDERFKEDDLFNYQHVKDPYNAIYAWKTNGILQIGQQAPAWQPTAALSAGSPLFVDRNGDNKLDSADVVVYDQTPKLSLGFGNVFKYGNFDLTIFLYGQYGAYKQNNSLAWADANNLVSGASSGTRDMRYVWSSENPGGFLPAAIYNDNALGVIGNVGNQIGSDYNIKKADFIRARNITLGYTVKATAITKYVKSLRVYIDVQNAFIITKYQGGDPEVTVQAVKGAAAPYPMVRTFSFGVNASF